MVSLSVQRLPLDVYSALGAIDGSSVTVRAYSQRQQAV